MKTIHAVYENGVFRPTEPVSLPEGTPVDVVLHQVEAESETSPRMSEGLARIYAILGERHESGHRDTAERHNEHQPDNPAHRGRVKELLSRRFRSGRHDIAERHNEHQP